MMKRFFTAFGVLFVTCVAVFAFQRALFYLAMYLDEVTHSPLIVLLCLLTVTVAIGAGIFTILTRD